MPGYQYVYPEGTASALYEQMKNTTDFFHYRRLQSIYLRAKFGYLPEKIAKITGLSISRVRQLHTAYRQNGIVALCASQRGGRNHCYLSVQEEADFLKTFQDQAKKGGVITIERIKRAYEKQVGKPVHRSMLYKLLHRHGWRKIVPRPYHPKQDKQAVDAFKKTSAIWLPKELRPLNSED